jgi:hypothetical protein
VDVEGAISRVHLLKVVIVEQSLVKKSPRAATPSHEGLWIETLYTVMLQ